METLATPIRDALLARGYTTLTPVQSAVNAPEVAGRDLRISSQTGSGKTVAIAIAIAAELAAEDAGPKPKALPCRPRAIVVVPTRELAAQVQGELAWALVGSAGSVVSVTGGTSVRDEVRALAAGPDVVVGTPGRLLDHLERGAIAPEALRIVVLDEADQMLDLGFREALESILGRLPVERRTVLVSATFSREVLALAKRYQRDALSVEGTQLGRANADIAHVVHIVPHAQRGDAVVNLLLMHPDDQTLVFVRTRADTNDLASALSSAGFAAAPLSGEMEQRERTRTLESFRTGALKVLVATDVAARGIHVEEIACVIHADPPGDSDAYTHRSGRTGRAGKKGTSVMLVPPSMVEKARAMLRRARIEAQLRPLPTADEILDLADERLIAKLGGAPESGTVPSARVTRLAARLLEEINPQTLLARLLSEASYAGPCAPRTVAAPRVAPPRAPAPPRASAPRGPERTFEPARTFEPPRGPRADHPRTPGAPSGPPTGPFVPFRITWGERHGADTRRVLALVCRRGEIRGDRVGSIRVGAFESVVEVSADVAPSFAAAAGKPDARDHRVRIERLQGDASPTMRVTDRRPTRPKWEPNDAPKGPKPVGGGEKLRPRAERRRAAASAS